MSDTPPRKALHAYLSADSHELWHDFAASNGVSVSALLECLAAEMADPSECSLGESLETIVREARKVDAARRRRL